MRGGWWPTQRANHSSGLMSRPSTCAKRRRCASSDWTSVPSKSKKAPRKGGRDAGRAVAAARAKAAATDRKNFIALSSKTQARVESHTEGSALQVPTTRLSPLPNVVAQRAPPGHLAGDASCPDARRRAAEIPGRARARRAPARGSAQARLRRRRGGRSTTATAVPVGWGRPRSAARRRSLAVDGEGRARPPLHRDSNLVAG